MFFRLNSYFHVLMSMDEKQLKVDVRGKTTCDKVNLLSIFCFVKLF